MPHKRKTKWKNLRAGLRLAPYSDTSLADANDVFFQMSPYQGGFIVTNRGEHIGFVKKSKSGWKKDGHYRPTDLDRAIRLLDENVYSFK
jgi:hypothetical protein